MTVRQRLGAVTVLVVALVGCSAPTVGTTTSGSTELEVYAAASLKDALLAVEEAYEATRPGTNLAVATDSSAALRAKIEQGAPADVFLSADTTNPQALVDRGLAAGPVTRFAGNELTVIVPIANPAELVTPADLVRPGVKLIAAADAVPITRYAAQLLANLAREAGYPVDFETAYAANVVSREDNVAAVVAKVGLGEGDAGIVYATDARSSDAVAHVDIPPGAAVVATYGGVVVAASDSQAPAAAFLAWLASPSGQAVLAGVGFLAPDR